MGYFTNIKLGIGSTFKGLSLTLKHFWAARNKRGNLAIDDENYFQKKEGFATLQYPHETFSIPERGRNQLDCEIDDCIVCDKCAKICPVDCIEIESIKSSELIRTTSDGSPVRLYAAKFDIDLAKCCFCGLCTTVCPTDCLTMNSEYDYSVSDVNLLNFAFSNLTPKESEEKRNLYEQFVAEKEAAKQLKSESVPNATPQISGFKPKPFINKKPLEAETETQENQGISNEIKEEDKIEKEELPLANEKKPIFKPKGNVVIEESKLIDDTLSNQNIKKPIFKPKAPSVDNSIENSINDEPLGPKVFTPKAKPEIFEKEVEKPAIKPVFKPKMAPSEEKSSQESKKVFIPKLKTSIDSEIDKQNTETPKSNNKPFIPKLKPSDDQAVNPVSEGSEIKSNNGFVPKMKEVMVENEQPKPKFTPKLKPRE